MEAAEELDNNINPRKAREIDGLFGTIPRCFETAQIIILNLPNDPAEKVMSNLPLQPSLNCSTNCC